MSKNICCKLSDNIVGMSDQIDELLKMLAKAKKSSKAQIIDEIMALSQAILNLHQATHN